MSIDFLCCLFFGWSFFLEKRIKMLLVGIKKQDDMAQIGEQLDTLPSLIRTCVACKKRLDRNSFYYYNKKEE